MRRSFGAGLAGLLAAGLLAGCDTGVVAATTPYCRAVRDANQASQIATNHGHRPTAHDMAQVVTMLRVVQREAPESSKAEWGRYLAVYESVQQAADRPGTIPPTQLQSRLAELDTILSRLRKDVLAHCRVSLFG